MIKFISSSFLLLLFIGIVSAEFSSVKGNGEFTPSTDLRGTFSQQSSQSGGYHKADLYFKTTMPSLNPDQSGVSNINCNDNKITLSLNGGNAIEQVNNWPDNVILLISDNWECFGKKETQFFVVSGKVVDVPNKSVTFTSKDCNISEMSEEFLLDVSWVDDKPKRRRKRRLNKRAPIDVNKKLSLNVLFDEKTGKSSKPNIPLINLDQENTGESLLCANCFMAGEATISMKIGGKFKPKFTLTDAFVSVNGNVRVNLDLTVTGKVGASFSPPEIELLNTPLAPLGVQNIFNIGPALVLAASSKISADVTGKVRTGGEISLPSFSAKASFVDEPKFEQSGFEPKTKSFDPTVGVAVSADISGTLKPQIAFGISVLNGLFTIKTGFQIITTLDSSISVGTDNGCNGKDPHLKSSLNGNLGFFVKDKNFPIVEFPSVSLLDQCL